MQVTRRISNEREREREREMDRKKKRERERERETERENMHKIKVTEKVCNQNFYYGFKMLSIGEYLEWQITTRHLATNQARVIRTLIF